MADSLTAVFAFSAFVTHSRIFVNIRLQLGNKNVNHAANVMQMSKITNAGATYYVYFVAHFKTIVAPFAWINYISMNSTN